MMVKLYVDWSNNLIFSEKEAQELARNVFSKQVTNDEIFDQWLSNHYCYLDLFNMKEDEKRNIRVQFMAEMEEVAWQDFIKDGYEEVFVEI